MLFPTLSALNSPPTATGGSVSRSAHPPHPLPLKLQRPQTLRRPRSVSHSVAPARPRSLFSDRPEHGPGLVDVEPSTHYSVRPSCVAVCGAVPLGRRSRRPLYTTRHRPPLSPSLSLLSRSSLSSLFRVVADAVAVALVAEVAAVVPVAAAVLDRELRPQPHLRTARSNRGPRLRTQTSPPYCRRRRCPGPRRRGRRCCPCRRSRRCRPPPRMLSLPVPVLSCRPRRRCCGRRRSRVLATPRLPDETRPPPLLPPRPNPNSPLASRPEPSFSRHAPEPSSCVSPPTATPPPSRETRPTFLERDSD